MSQFFFNDAFPPYLKVTDTTTNHLVETFKMNVFMLAFLLLPHPNIVKSTKASLGCEDVVIGD